MNEDINLKANEDKDVEYKPTFQKVLMLQRLLSEFNIRKNFLKSQKKKFYQKLIKTAINIFTEE